jgi:hypothetical protein
MSDIYVNNSGFTKTLFRNKKLKKNNSSEFSWNADYDGKIANISFDSNVNGTKSHKEVKLNNNDLEHMLSLPNVNGRLDNRLMNDFKIFSNPNSNYKEKLSIPTKRMNTTTKINNKNKKYSIKKSIKPKSQRTKNKLKKSNTKITKRNI